MVLGTIYILSAPSGTGKSSLIKALLKTQSLNNIKISVSYTTRVPRSNEKHGEHYFFISHDKFKAMINQDKFLEYAEVFGNYYGTSREIIERTLMDKIDILLDIDWQGAQQIRAKIPQSRSIFVLPPSKEELYYRLYNRGQDSKEIIIKRMEQAIMEMRHYFEYDYLVINNDFNIAMKDLKSIIYAERLRINYQKQYHNDLINKLLTN